MTAKNKDDMGELIQCVKHNSERACKNLNVKKTTVMSTAENINIFSDDEVTSTVTNCMYLVVITDGEIKKKKISSSNAAMANLRNIIHTLEVPTNIKLCYCIQQSFQQCCVGAKGSRSKKDG
jgi:hypothetical protein